MGDVEGQATGLTPSSNARHPVGEGDNIYQCFMFYVINFLSNPDMIDVNFIIMFLGLEDHSATMS